MEGTAAGLCETSAHPSGGADDLTRVEVELLGYVAIRSDSGVSHVTGRPATILASLALARGPVAASQLIDLLWLEPPANERNALQRHVSRLRQLFRERGAEGAVRHHGGCYELDRRLVSLDVDRADESTLSSQLTDPVLASQLDPSLHPVLVEAAKRPRRLRRRPAATSQRLDPNVCGCALGGFGVGCDVPAEVSHQLRRWLEIRSAYDETAIVIRQWLATLECGAHVDQPTR